MKKQIASSFRLVPFESTGMVSTKGKTYVYPGGGIAQPKVRRDNNAGFTSRSFNYKPKPTDAIKWLEIARAGDGETREGLRYLHNEGDRAFGTDGYRIHVVQIKNFAPVSLTIPAELKKRKKDPVKSPNLTPIIPTQHSTIVTISRYDLSRALAACAPFAKESSNIVRLTISAPHIIVSASSAETGCCDITIAPGAHDFNAPSLYAEDNATYKMDGDPIQIAFNYRYMQDAIAGMPPVFNMGLYTPNAPGHLWGDVDGIRREAIIMPMYF